MMFLAYLSTFLLGKQYFKMRILFIDTVFPFLKEKLENHQNICDTAYEKNKLEIEEIISDYDGIIIRSRFIIDKQFINKAKKLRFIARAGSGLENIDVEYAKMKDIKCINAANGNSQAVAEHALGMLLTLLHNLNKADKEVRRGKWRREENRGVELSQKTIGIIGFGNTGSAFSRLLQGFNVNILAYDKYLRNHSFRTVMEKIYAEADIISLHIPLTDDTTYLVNDQFIDKFKKPFYLINTSRGKCLNTKSLVTALKNGKIKGVCLDVLEYEKDSFEKLSRKGLPKEMIYLTKSNKSILSPHIAGWTNESNARIAEILLEKITAYAVE